ncbi:MAG: hypothetical protein QXK24_08875 [Ignisphaera sp.]
MAKGLTPEEVVGRFTGGVEGAGSKWEERTLAGASRYADWINYWYPGCLRTVAAAAKLVDPWERSKKVGTYTQKKAAAYKAEKIAKLLGIARSPSPSPA